MSVCDPTLTCVTRPCLPSVTCLAYRMSQTKEPLLKHEVISRPWDKSAADLCEFNGRTFLVVSDYFSGFIVVSRLQTITTQAVVRS